MRRLRHALCCAVPALALASVACGRALLPIAPAVIPATFAILMHRIQKAGDRGTVSLVVRTTSTTITEEGDRIVKREEESQDVELRAAERVLRVDATGEPLDLEYTIESLTVQTSAGRSEVIARARVVTASRGPERVTFHAAEALSPAAEKALAQLVAPRSSAVTDDDMFGTAEPQAIGAIWPVNTALAATTFSVPATETHGQMELTGLAQVAGQTCLEVTGEFEASSKTIEFRSTLRKLLPVDTAAPEVDSTFVVDVGVTMPIGPPATPGPARRARTTVIGHRETRRRFTPLR